LSSRTFIDFTAGHTVGQFLRKQEVIYPYTAIVYEGLPEIIPESELSRQIRVGDLNASM
jgi:hypothetical protein